eukprot:s1214_g13.t1
MLPATLARRFPRDLPQHPDGRRRLQHNFKLMEAAIGDDPDRRRSYFVCRDANWALPLAYLRGLGRCLPRQASLSESQIRLLQMPPALPPKSLSTVVAQWLEQHPIRLLCGTPGGRTTKPERGIGTPATRLRLTGVPEPNGSTARGRPRWAQRAQSILRTVGTSSAAMAQVPWRKADRSNTEPLNAERDGRYRSGVGSGIYFPADRRGIAYPAKELAPHMSAPRECESEYADSLAKCWQATPGYIQVVASEICAIEETSALMSFQALIGRAA